MPIKAKKVWIVGEKQFDTYNDARRYVAAHRAEAERSFLIEFLRKNAYFQDPTSGPCALADAVLDAYEIKPKKRNA